MNYDARNLFCDPQDRHKIYCLLRAFVEEWGSENVVICFPHDWPRSVDIKLSRITFEHGPRNKIFVRVNYESVKKTFEVSLAPDF